MFVVVAPAVNALAANGCVRVNVQFYNAMDGFCDDSLGLGLCDGALYPAADVNRAMPLAEATVRLRSNTGLVLGYSSTNAAGTAVIQWTQEGNSDAWARLEVELRHKDDRYRVVSTPGATPPRRYHSYRWFANQNVSPCTIPVEAGTMTLGSSFALDDAANAFAAAGMAWRNAFSLSNRLLTEFTDVEIVTSGSPCGPVDNRVACATRHPNQDFSPDPYPAPLVEPKGVVFLSGPVDGYKVALVAHELGHLANSFAHTGGDYLGWADYGYPTGNVPDDSGGWHLESPEYGSVAFEEGLASFWAVRTLYSSTAQSPYECKDIQGACPDYAAQEAWLVTGDFAIGGCAAGNQKSRWPGTTLRFLWDVYDNEPSPDESISRPTYTFVDTLYAYGNGYGNHQKDEVAALITILGMPFLIQDDPNGRAATDFQAKHLSTYGVSLAAAYTLNCSSPGD